MPRWQVLENVIGKLRINDLDTHFEETDEPFTLALPNNCTEDDFKEYLLKGSFAELFSAYRIKLCAGNILISRCDGKVQAAVAGMLIYCVQQACPQLIPFTNVDTNYMDAFNNECTIKPDGAFGPEGSTKRTLIIEVGTSMQALDGKAHKWSLVVGVKYVLLVCVKEVIPCTGFVYTLYSVRGRNHIVPLKSSYISLMLQGNTPNAVIKLNTRELFDGHPPAMVPRSIDIDLKNCLSRVTEVR